MKLIAIINKASGSVPQSASSELQDIIEDAGHTVLISEISGDELEDCCDNFLNEEADGVVAFGGDGTLACVLNKFGPTGLPIIILPGGTMNLLVKRVHGGDQDWKDILSSALNAKSSVSLTASEANGRRFYVGMLVGKLTELTKTREHLREGAVDKAVAAIATGNAFDFDTALTIQANNKTLEATAAGVFVPDVAEDSLHLVTIDPNSLSDLLKIGLESLYGNWDHANSIESEYADTLSIASSGSEAVPVTFDGELAEVSFPLQVELITEAARVWSARSE